METTSFLATPRTWVTVAFLIFVALAARKFWTIATQMLDARAATIRAELEEAAKLRAEAEAMLTAASQRRDAALKEAEELLVTARREADRLGSEARDEAAAAAKRREKMALDRIAAAEKAAVNDVRALAATVATRAAEEVIREGLPASVSQGLVQRAIDGLPTALAAE